MSSLWATSLMSGARTRPSSGATSRNWSPYGPQTINKWILTMIVHENVRSPLTWWNNQARGPLNRRRADRI